MKGEQDYLNDLAQIRSMMERSSRFLSLSGWAGVMAGIYALTGCFIAVRLLDFAPAGVDYPAYSSAELMKVSVLAVIVLILALGTAIWLSARNAVKRGEKIWNNTSRIMTLHMAVPLVTGGLLLLVLMDRGWIGLLAPCSLIFYGLALYDAGKFTFPEIRSLGLINTFLGLLGFYFVEYGVVCWALGFGFFHIVYGMYMHFRYER